MGMKPWIAMAACCIIYSSDVEASTPAVPAVPTVQVAPPVVQAAPARPESLLAPGRLGGHEGAWRGMDGTGRWH